MRGPLRHFPERIFGTNEISTVLTVTNTTPHEKIKSNMFGKTYIIILSVLIFLTIILNVSFTHYRITNLETNQQFLLKEIIKLKNI